jgi:hypothetical protein
VNFRAKAGFGIVVKSSAGARKMPGATTNQAHRPADQREAAVDPADREMAARQKRQIGW